MKKFNPSEDADDAVDLAFLTDALAAKKHEVDLSSLTLVREEGAETTYTLDCVCGKFSCNPKLDGAEVFNEHVARASARQILESEAMRQIKSRTWAEGFEDSVDWISNNPTPAGIPMDPPLNPYGDV